MVNGAGNTRQWVEAPPVTPSPYGLFSAATVVDDPGGVNGLPWLRNGITWEAPACGAAHETVAACEEADALTVTDGIDAVEASAFTAYHLHRCRLPGRDWETGDERAADSLRLGEQRAAEAHLWAGMAAATALEDVGTGLHPVDAFAALEDHLGGNYGGVGVIHVSPGSATLLEAFNLLERVGLVQQAKGTGTRVAVGGGYAAGSMFATGQVMVRRAATPEVIRSAAGSLRSNEYLALAARPYVIGWECVTAAASIVSPFGPGDGGGP